MSTSNLYLAVFLGSKTSPRRLAWDQLPEAAAAAMFEKHPHFMIFPGEAIEIMPVLPVPGV